MPVGPHRIQIYEASLRSAPLCLRHWFCPAHLCPYLFPYTHTKPSPLNTAGASWLSLGVQTQGEAKEGPERRLEICKQETSVSALCFRALGPSTNVTFSQVPGSLFIKVREHPEPAQEDDPLITELMALDNTRQVTNVVLFSFSS